MKWIVEDVEADITAVYPMSTDYETNMYGLQHQPLKSWYRRKIFKIIKMNFILLDDFENSELSQMKYEDLFLLFGVS